MFKKKIVSIISGSRMGLHIRNQIHDSLLVVMVNHAFLIIQFNKKNLFILIKKMHKIIKIRTTVYTFLLLYLKIFLEDQ